MTEGWAIDPADTNNFFTNGNGTYGDVAMSYWMVTGLKAAETTLGTTGSHPRLREDRPSDVHRQPAEPGDRASFPSGPRSTIT